MTDRLRVLEIGPRMTGGGAANLAADIHRMIAPAVDTTFVVSGGAPGRVARPAVGGSHLGERANGVIDVVIRKLVDPADAFVWGRGSVLATEIDRAVKDVDVVQVYWSDRMLGVARLERIVSSGKPVVLVPMDFEPLTGGCHYPYQGCTQYFDDCSACPLSDSPILRRSATKNRAHKRRILSSGNLTVIAGNGWFAERIIAAGTETGRVRVVYPPVDDCYHLARSGALRPRLGIAPQAPVLIAGATNLLMERKRITEAVAIAAGVLDALPEAHLLLAGSGEPEIPSSIADRVHRLGPLSQPDLAAALADADVFVSTSIEDGGPMMVAAAWSAGTAVAAHRIGYAADLLDEPEQGVLLEPDELGANVAGVLTLLRGASSGREAVSRACRQLGHHFHVDTARDGFVSALDNAAGRRSAATLNSVANGPT